MQKKIFKEKCLKMKNQKERKLKKNNKFKKNKIFKKKLLKDIKVTKI